MTVLKELTLLLAILILTWIAGTNRDQISLLKKAVYDLQQKPNPVMYACDDTGRCGWYRVMEKVSKP